jgi:hypothetical protein
MKRPDLSNLEIYGEIGTAPDHNEIYTATLADYRERYLAGLADHDAFSMIREDQRLWRSAAA